MIKLSLVATIALYGTDKSKKVNGELDERLLIKGK
jgi:hypothetical protein